MKHESHVPTLWGVAGNTVALRGDPAIMAILGQWVATFSVESRPAFELTVYEHLEALPQPDAPSGITFEDGCVYYCSSLAHGYADFGQARGELALDEPTSWSEADYFLRIVMGVLAVQSGSLLFHGAGVVEADCSWVLFGPSGAGKTTAARASWPRPVLHDDLLVLQPGELGWEVHGTPFMSSGGLRPPAPVSARLKGLCNLVQAKQVKASPLSQAKAVGRLLACVPVVTSSPRLAGLALNMCYQLAQSVPCYDLHFRPDSSFWEVLHDC